MAPFPILSLARRAGAAQGCARPAGRPQALHARLGELLAPVAGWGGVALRLGHAMAGLHCSLAQAGVQVDADDVLQLTGPHHAAWLSQRGIARVELIEADTAAAGAAGLRWLDSRGQQLGEALLATPGAREPALAWLRQRGAPHADAARRRRAGAPVPVMFAPQPGLVSVDPLARGAAAAAWARAALLSAGGAASLRLDLGGPGAALRCSGPLAACPTTTEELQAEGPQTRLRLQPARVSGAARVLDRDGACGLLLTDDAGGSLLLHPQGAGAAGWLAGVAELASALRLAPPVVLPA